MVIRRVGALSCARIAGLLYAILGLIFGAIVSAAALIGAFNTPADEPGFVTGLFGVAAVVLLPIFYGCLGFVMTLIMASLYNAIAGVVGGVELDVR